MTPYEIIRTAPDDGRGLRQWCLEQAAETVRAIMAQGGPARGYDLTWADRSTTGLARKFHDYITGAGAPETPRKEETAGRRLMTATELLRRLKKGIRTTDFNRRMEERGLLERHGGGWRLTEDGLAYGENKSEGAGRVRPVYDPERFRELTENMYNHDKYKKK